MAAPLARPATAGNTQTLSIVPQVALNSIDPLWASWQIAANFIRCNGKDAWFGWPTDPKILQIYDAWLGASDPGEQTRLEREYQLQAFDTLPFIPLDGYRQTAAWRDNVTGILKGPSVVFWNVSKT